MCNSTTDSAPKLETSAILPVSGRSSACFRTEIAACWRYQSFRLCTRSGRSFRGIGRLLFIKCCLERGHAKTTVRLQECLCGAVAVVQIGRDQPLDGRDDLIRGKARTGALTQFSGLRMVAAKRDLVVFHTRPVQPQNADMADMVMAARIDAARYLDLQLADFMLQLEFVKAGGDLLRDGNGPRGGKRAVIHAGAGDDIRDEADIGRGQPVLFQDGMNRWQ